MILPFPLSGATIKIARRCKAKAFILGRFGKYGQKIRVDAQLHDVADGRLIVAEHIIANEADQLISQIDVLSLKMESHLGAQPVQNTSRALSRVMTDNVNAYRYYSIALEKTQAYHNKEAIELFEKAISLDPYFAMAHARIGYTYAIRWEFHDKGRHYLETASRCIFRQKKATVPA